jgi:hypothetical protein
VESQHAYVSAVQAMLLHAAQCQKRPTTVSKETVQAMLLTHAAQLPTSPPRAYKSAEAEQETKGKEKTGIMKDQKGTVSSKSDGRRKAQDQYTYYSVKRDLLQCQKRPKSDGRRKAQDPIACAGVSRGGLRRVNAIDEKCSHVVLNASHDGAVLAAEAEEKRAGEASSLCTPNARVQRFGLRSARAEAQDASPFRRAQGLLVPRPRTSLAEEAPRRSQSALSHKVKVYLTSTPTTVSKETYYSVKRDLLQLSHLTSARANAWDQKSEACRKADLVHTPRAHSSMGLQKRPTIEAKETYYIHGHHARSRAQANCSSLRSQNRPRSSWDHSNAGWRWWQAPSCNTSAQAAPQRTHSIENTFYRDQQLEHADLLHKTLREPPRVAESRLLDERLDAFSGVSPAPCLLSLSLSSPHPQRTHSIENTFYTFRVQAWHITRCFHPPPVMRGWRPSGSQPLCKLSQAMGSPTNFYALLHLRSASRKPCQICAFVSSVCFVTVTRELSCCMLCAVCCVRHSINLVCWSLCLSVSPYVSVS